MSTQAAQSVPSQPPVQLRTELHPTVYQANRELTDVVANDLHAHHRDFSRSLALYAFSFTAEALDRLPEDLPDGASDRDGVPRAHRIAQLAVLVQAQDRLVEPELRVRDLGRDFVQQAQEEVRRVRVERRAGGGAEQGDEVGEEGRRGERVRVEEQQREQLHRRVL